MNWIKKVFKTQDVAKTKETSITPCITPEPSSEWIEFDPQTPPHEVVLAACYTYDCGWVMDTAWWREDKHFWMTTGGVEDIEAHLPYSHWRKLPPDPDGQYLS